MAVTNNTSVKVTETMTTDFGDTSDIELEGTLTGGGDLRLQGVNNNASANYFIIYIARELSF
jgi:hypothetical protein